MKALRELLDMLSPFGVSDEDIILEYYRQNHLEEKAIGLMARLSATKIQEYKYRLDFAESWSTCVPIGSIIREYGSIAGEKLLDFTYFVILHVGQQGFGESCPTLDAPVPEHMLEWLKDHVPTLRFPKGPFFQPALESLRKLGIYFKNDPKASQ